MLFRTDEILSYLEDLFPSLCSGHNCSCISNEDACVIPLPETFYINDILQNWNRDCYSRMQKAWPFHCCCSHQSVASPSLCSCVRAHGGHFKHILWCFHRSLCWVNAENFWICGFTVSPFCLSPKCNLSETFTRYIWHYAGEVEDITMARRSCLLNRCAKIKAFSCGLMTSC